MSDFGCYMIVYNQTSEDLTLSDLPTPSWGSWHVPPPSTLKANTNSARLALVDSSGPAGSEGQFTYKTSAGSTVTATFGCPYSGNNYGSWTGDFKNNQNFDLSWNGFVGNNGTPQQDGIDTSGHPCSYNFYIKDPSK